MTWLRGLGAILLAATAAVVFDLESCVRDATHVVVATEGEKIDGALEVLESWRGDLEPGAELLLPDLARFEPDDARTVTKRDLGEWSEGHPSRVSGKRIVLFLKRRADGGFDPASALREARVESSLCWIENEQAYAFAQAVIPGPILIYPARITEKQLRERVAGR